MLGLLPGWAGLAGHSCASHSPICLQGPQRAPKKPFQYTSLSLGNQTFGDMLWGDGEKKRCLQTWVYHCSVLW